MASYRYQHGDRPLNGYTIEQALGRGGFGEVYYAVSDSGRQVALKSVQNYEDIELRGISHCMNLKSPHLVSIFDVKHSDRGDPFVIMEYVAGPSLRDLLDEAPNGLGPEKAAWFIREIARGLALLHDNGVVHRDLKPHNVFFEDGYVKVGDYSLSKVITASHRSGHTLTVGTVHYMAPEIGVGRYDRTVDIYALGVLLFEMLTGQPPFVGETMGEVLMKHMAGDVDVSQLDKPYASVVSKAMAKDPSERYQTVDELVADLFGNATVADGVSTFSPNSLTVVAGRAAARVAQMHGSSSPAGSAGNRQGHSRPQSAQRGHVSSRKPSALVESAPYHLGRMWSRLGAAFCFAPARYADRPRRTDDPISPTRRVIFAIIVMLTMAWISNANVKPSAFDLEEFGDEDLWGQFFVMAAIVSAAKFAAYLLPGGQSGIPSLFGRLATVVGAALAVFFIEENFRPFSRGDETVIAAIFPLLFMDWQWLTARSRPGRIRLTPCLGAALIAFVCSAIFDGQPVAAAAIIGGAALAAQTISAFDPASSRRLPETVKWVTSARESLGAWYGWRFPEIAAELRALDEHTAAHETEQRSELSFSVAASDSDHAETLAYDSNEVLESDAVAALRASQPAAGATSARVGLTASQGTVPDDPPSRFAGLILCLLPFVTFGMIPFCGLHRFVSGRILTGLLWFFTLGLAGIGQLVDLILIALGEFRDSYGRPLHSRSNGEAVNGLSSVPAASLVSNGLAVLGGMILAADVLIGFLVAIRFPELLKADVLGRLGILSSDLESIFGTKSWPNLLFDLMALFAGILAVMATGLLFASRKRHGIHHMAKVPLAIIPLGMTFSLLSSCFYHFRWERVADGINQSKIGVVLEAFLNVHEFVPSCIGAAVAFTVALLILAWPPNVSAENRAAVPHVPVKQEA